MNAGVAVLFDRKTTLLDSLRTIIVTVVFIFGAIQRSSLIVKKLIPVISFFVNIAFCPKCFVWFVFQTGDYNIDFVGKCIIFTLELNCVAIKP